MSLNAFLTGTNHKKQNHLAPKPEGTTIVLQMEVQNTIGFE